MEPAIHKPLSKLCFHQSPIDKALYKQTTYNTTTYVLVYVNGLLITGEDKNINKLISKLNKEYPVIDLGEAKYYLGINTNWLNKNTITLDKLIKFKN